MASAVVAANCSIPMMNSFAVEDDEISIISDTPEAEFEEPSITPFVSESTSVSVSMVFQDKNGNLKNKIKKGEKAYFCISLIDKNTGELLIDNINEYTVKIDLIKNGEIISSTDEVYTSNKTNWNFTCTSTGEWTVKATLTGAVEGEVSSTINVTNPFEWGKDNLNFTNSDNCYFEDGTETKTLRNLMKDNEYQEKLKSELNNGEYQRVFKGRFYTDGYQYAKIDDEFNGVCHGMSAVTMLAKAGLLPFEEYQSGAGSLYEFNKPLENSKLSSLILYYFLLQHNNHSQKNFRSTKINTNEININKIISELDKYDTVMVGFRQSSFGGHTILAYDYDTITPVTYGGIECDKCIYICDPNSEDAYDENYNIYYNSQTYEWIIPGYDDVSTTNDAYVNFICGSTDEINMQGYLAGGSGLEVSDSNMRINIDNDSVDSHSLYVYDKNENSEYIEKAISNGVANSGWNSPYYESAFKIIQDNIHEIKSTISYEKLMLSASSPEAKEIFFDHDGYVSVEGNTADYSLSITSDENYPTDWFTFSAAGKDASYANMKLTADGYILESDNLSDVAVYANNKYDEVSTAFSTEYNSVLLYQIDADTIGVNVDKDGNGTYETCISNPVKTGIGDVNFDGNIDASDASQILDIYAVISANKTPAESKEQLLAADVDNDGTVTSADSSKVLSYYAYTSSGGNLSIDEFMKTTA